MYLPAFMIFQLLYAVLIKLGMNTAPLNISTNKTTAVLGNNVV
jgi:hypothetical protein